MSLPVQYVTSPFALSIDATSMALAPFVWPVLSLPPLLLSSSPHAATAKAMATTRHTTHKTL